MRVWLTLVRRELAGYFVSWTGYTVIAVVAFLFGLSFYILLNQLNLSEADKPLTEMFYDSLSLFLLLAIGLKGGEGLAQQALGPLLPQLFTVVLLGVAQTLFSSLVQDYVKAHGWMRDRPEGRR